MFLVHMSMFKGEAIPECTRCGKRGVSIPEAEVNVWKGKHRCEAEA